MEHSQKEESCLHCDQIIAALTNKPDGLPLKELTASTGLSPNTIREHYNNHLKLDNKVVKSQPRYKIYDPIVEAFKGRTFFFEKLHYQIDLRDRERKKILYVSTSCEIRNQSEEPQEQIMRWFSPEASNNWEEMNPKIWIEKGGEKSKILYDRSHKPEFMERGNPMRDEFLVRFGDFKLFNDERLTIRYEYEERDLNKHYVIHRLGVRDLVFELIKARTPTERLICSIIDPDTNSGQYLRIKAETRADLRTMRTNSEAYGLRMEIRNPEFEKNLRFEYQM